MTNILPLLFIPALTGCWQADERIVVQTEIIRLEPPAALLQDCRAPGPTDYRTNMDLVRRIIDLNHALEDCNADKAALRQWAAGDQHGDE